MAPFNVCAASVMQRYGECADCQKTMTAAPICHCVVCVRRGEEQCVLMRGWGEGLSAADSTLFLVLCQIKVI